MYHPRFTTVPLLLLLGSIVKNVKADTSLFVPGVGEIAISAGFVGSGPDGRTTWQLQQGTPTGSTTFRPGAFPGTGTLVEDSTEAIYVVTATSDRVKGTSVVHETFVASESCAISGSTAVCVEVASVLSTATTTTETTLATPFAVEGGGTVTGTPNPIGTPSASSNTLTSAAATTSPPEVKSAAEKSNIAPLLVTAAVIVAGLAAYVV